MVLGLSLAAVRAETPAEGTTPSFEHGTHWATGVLDCADCHTALQATAPVAATMPRNTVCITCHEDEDRAAWFPRPSSHGPDRLATHQGLENLDRRDCAVCHRQSLSCTECHHGPRDGYLVPRDDWLVTGHAQSADIRAQACASCHDLVEDCSGCHLEQKVEPRNHRSPAWGTRHARYGKRVAACVMCHGSPARVCTTCHG